MKKSLVIFLLLSSITSLAQSFDSASVIYTAKLAAASNFWTVSNTNAFHKNIRTTSYEFIAQSGLKNVCFIKIKLRSRNALEEYLFYEGLTENEHRKYIILDDALAMKILKDTIAIKYHITDSTENDVIEKLLKKKSSYYDTTRNRAPVDYYFAYLIKEGRLLYLKNSRNIREDNSAFWEAFYNQDIMSSELKREIADKDIPKSDWSKMIRIGEMGILNDIVK